MFQSEGGGLESGADNHDGGTDEDHLSATKRISDEDGDDGADEATQVIRGDSNALVGGTLGGSAVLALGLGVDGGKLAEEDGQGEDTTHDTLIITKEQEICASNGADGPVEGVTPHAEEFLAHDGGCSSRVRQDGTRMAWIGERWSGGEREAEGVEVL